MRGDLLPSTVPLLTYIEFLILTSLLIEDNHGLGLIQSILDRTNGEVFLSPGTLYAALKRLYKQKWIVESKRVLPNADGNQERRRYYTLTSQGRDMIVGELNRMEMVVNQTHELLDQADRHFRYQSLHPLSASIKT